MFFVLILCVCLNSAVCTMQILSLTSGLNCKVCPEWSSLLLELTANTSIEVLEFSPESNVMDLQSFGIDIGKLNLPSVWAVVDDAPPRIFSYPRTRGFLGRWLSDAHDNKWGLLTPLFSLKEISEFEVRYPVFVEILSEKQPTVNNLFSLSQVGFGWYPQPPFESPNGTLRRYGNNTIVRNANGRVFHNVNKSISAVWRQLLPGVIEEDDLSLEFVKEMVSTFTTDEVQIEVNGTLPMWWSGQLAEYPSTLFVHRPQLTDTPKTRTFRRDMEFVTPTVSNRTWLSEVHAGNVAPNVRPSWLPKDRRTGVHEVSGDTLSDWVAHRPETFVYFYDHDDQSCQNAFAGSSNLVARMIVPENDHEMFVERPRSGTCVKFVAGRPGDVVLCSELMFDKQEL